jgi:hypothetical protein
MTSARERQVARRSHATSDLQRARHQDVVTHLGQLAREAAANGVTQDELVDAFQALRPGLTEEQDDRVLEVLDGVVAWCHPDSRIFPAS